MNEFKGKLIEKENTVQINDRFKKREFVLENNDNAEYPNYCKFQLTQDRCSLLDSVNIGDELNVNFNLRGNKWEKDGKINYFTNIDAWKIETISNGPAPELEDIPKDNSDDLPF